MGAATARLMVREGGKVAIFDIDRIQGERLAAELGDGKAVFLSVDVTDPTAVEQAVRDVVARFGGLDILVNNAGAGCLAKSPDLAIDDWRRIMALDIDAIFYACKYAVPLIRRGGAIVNTASISGLGGDYGFTAYNAAKGAVINYTKALAVDHAADGIRANAVCPGLIETQLTDGIKEMPDLLQRWVDGIPMKRAGKPEEMASVIAFLASDDASYVTGAIIVADGGKMAWTGQPDATVLLQQG